MLPKVKPFLHAMVLIGLCPWATDFYKGGGGNSQLPASYLVLLLFITSYTDSLIINRNKEGQYTDVVTP